MCNNNIAMIVLLIAKLTTKTLLLFTYSRSAFGFEGLPKVNLTITDFRSII